MSNKAIIKEFDLGDGRKITIETGRLAKQADGSVVVRMGDAMLLATVVSNVEIKEGTDFLPLSVDYQEKFASVGRFPGGFLKREGRMSEYEILISRLVDRALRPMFPDNYHADTQVMISLISGDPRVQPDALAGLAASAAITISDIPFNGPISEVRIARVEGKMLVNPYTEDIEKADLDLIVAGSMDSIVMVEGEMKEVTEEVMLEAIKAAHEAIKIQCQAQLELRELCGNKPKREYEHEVNDEELRKDIRAAVYDKVYAVAKSANPNKQQRKENFKAILEEYVSKFSEEELEEKSAMIKRYFHDVESEAMRNCILDEGIRLDGRKTTDIRPIWAEVDYLPSTHGSAIFTRGETQSLTTVTLGSKLDEQMIDVAMREGSSKFLLQYNFPAFSTGEVKPNRGPARREIGHGNLAMRSLKVILPNENDCPYTIRVVSDILESNGSSSMATVCAGTLALMDSGVKITRPASGIAMGLIMDEKGRYAVLSDILGDEDHLGDMDFKVTGTEKGICACQMDLKIQGLSFEIMLKALFQAREGRMHILNEMLKAIPEPRADYKPHAPRIEKMIIAKEFIGAVIGPGGKVIQEMQRETNTTISIEEVNNEGIIEISSVDKAGIEAAKAKIKGIVAIPEIGEIYEGKVKNIMDFGAFIEFMPGKDGLLHISEITWERLDTMKGVFTEGDLVKVKLIDVDKKTGKFRLSRKVLLPKPENANQDGGRPQRKQPQS
ncbi:MAG: polyribonucleotide nucleotidyltransferase [Bacteroidetes bacterium]|nr:MAG: polyribonucleotide nucleotidyltransferase [Bacteroidota bacterium]REK06968.1 MAG: polyribonucleotide nucleotidyltransferase [Bacteroidota bacterium]REK33684.1 MAG: polyribonucleotide nucleotidyltransferase [Bacteroidota bacterium]REK47239.1 MAG: polyribonucleotide nucleotidyltransferase [Bacteroidota bacterium]